MAIPEPMGIDGLFVDPKGEVVASVAEFDTSKPAGFSVLEIQTIRVKSNKASRFFCTIWGIRKRRKARHDCQRKRVYWGCASICMEAVKQNGMALEHVNAQTEAICMTAMDQIENAQYANDRYFFYAFFVVLFGIYFFC